jgi:NADPH:quinone reductase-like Zn-dependent oxidoreductase
MRYLELAPGEAVLAEGPPPELSPGDARVRVLACGICGTDVHALRGMVLPKGARYPIRPGHEVAGIVEEVHNGTSGVSVGDLVAVRLVHGRDTVFAGDVPYARSFGDVPTGAPLLYLNSLLDVALALNQGNFAETYHVGAGPAWRVTLRRASRR